MRSSGVLLPMGSTSPTQCASSDRIGGDVRFQEAVDLCAAEKAVEADGGLSEDAEAVNGEPAYTDTEVQPER